jgi:hypothetical protein
MKDTWQRRPTEQLSSLIVEHHEILCGSFLAFMVRSVPIRNRSGWLSLIWEKKDDNLKWKNKNILCVYCVAGWSVFAFTSLLMSPI